MSFKYINPGYAKLMDVVLSSSYLTQLTGFDISRTGVAYYNKNQSTYTNYIKVDSTHATGDLWAKTDFYWDSSQTPRFGYLGEYKGTDRFYNGAYGDYSSSNDFWYSIYCSGSAQTLFSIYRYAENIESVTGLRQNAINTIWLHLHYGDSSSGYVEFMINKKYWKVDGKVEAISNPRFLTHSYYVPFSNVIVSDEYVSPYERIVPLTASNTITNMDSLTGGLFVADTASETLLQSVNTTALINDYGSNTQVTGIALIGNPAYQVDDVLGNLSSITKHNNIVTSHDRITLLTDTDSMIVSSFSLPSDTTIADLSNMQFGWRAEE